MCPWPLGWVADTHNGDGIRTQKMAKRWYIVHAYSNFEKKVADSIKERALAAGLEEQLEEVLVPMEEVVEMRRGRKVSAERKFFPGYVLVKMELSDETYHLIKDTPKVTGFLERKTSRYRLPRPKRCISCSRCRKVWSAPNRRLPLKSASRCVSPMGRSHRFNGLVEEVDEERARLKVAVSIFGRATPVELEYAQVEKL